MKSLLDVIGISESIVFRFLFAFQLQMTDVYELNYYIGRRTLKILQHGSAICSEAVIYLRCTPVCFCDHYNQNEHFVYNTANEINDVMNLKKTTKLSVKF